MPYDSTCGQEHATRPATHLQQRHGDGTQSDEQLALPRVVLQPQCRLHATARGRRATVHVRAERTSQSAQLARGGAGKHDHLCCQSLVVRVPVHDDVDVQGVAPCTRDASHGVMVRAAGGGRSVAASGRTTANPRHHVRYVSARVHLRGLRQSGNAAHAAKRKGHSGECVHEPLPLGSHVMRRR